MTQDFNYKLMKYLTGKIVKENGSNDEVIKKIDEIEYSDFSSYLPENWNDLRFEIVVNDKITSNVILYGGYKDKNNNSFGIIMVLSQDFKPLNVFYKYENGTSLRYIMALNQADDGTFYMLDCVGFPKDRVESFQTSEKRFIMVNNFIQNNKLVMRKSYIFPNDYKNFYAYKIFKDVNSSNYCFVGRRLAKASSSYDFDEIRVITLKLEVGQSNEWIKYDSDGSGWLLGDCYVEYNEENNLFVEMIISSTSSDSSSLANKLYMWTKDFNSNSFILKEIVTFDYHPYIDSQIYKNQSVFINKNEVYFVQNNQWWGVPGVNGKKYIGLYHYNITTSKLNTIYEKYLGEYDYCNLEAIYIDSNQNKLYIQYNTNINSSDYKADYYFQQYNGEWKPIKLGLQQNFIYSHRALYVTNVFNMIQVYMYPINPRNQTWKLYNILEIYNPTNYNGIPYENTNSLVPNSGILYDENNNIIFARNLYNKTINNRITQSTIEVPNNYLNNTIISTKELYSKDNNVMVKNRNAVTKNIYETLFINFINSLQIINENDVNNHILNPTGATRLNISVSDLIDYDNAKATKIRINYDDGTNEIKDVSNNIEQIQQSDSLIFTNYDFTVYNPETKNIKTIDIISNDETTIYQTISDLSFASNKYYNIIQPVQINNEYDIIR